MLAQFAIASCAVKPADPVAKSVGCDFSAPETGEAGDADIPGQDPIDEFLIPEPCLRGEIGFSASVSERLADRRCATLVGVVQLLI